LEKSTCAIVVTYNRLALLKQCLDKLLNQSEPVSHIVVVNNKSTDGTTSYLNALKNPKVLVLNMSENLGGAKGFNTGMKYAFQKTQDNFFWIMDDDTFPDEDALRELLKAEQDLHAEVGFLCSNVRWKDGQTTNIPAVASRWSEKIDSGIVKVETATFVSVMVSRRVVRELGLPTAALFIWGDDTEFTTRLSAKYPCYFVTNSHVLHFSEKNISDVTVENDSLNRLSRYRYMYRNLIFIDKKYHSKKKMIKRILGNLISALLILFKSHDHRFKRSGVILSGTFKGLIFNPKTEYVK